MMTIDINAEYSNGAFYRREKDLTYSNRYTRADKHGAIFLCVFCYMIVVALIGVAIYVVFWESLIWPIFIIGLGAILPIFIAVVVTDHFRKMLTFQVTVELNETGFSQLIKNRKTEETKELQLPFKTMESVTMGRFLYVVRGRKYSPGTYWICIELAMKGITQDGELILKRFPLKNPDEIRLWIEKLQQNQIPIYFIDRLLKDLTLEDYDHLDKEKYPEETGELRLAYKTEGQTAPLTWDGKQIYH